MLTENFQEQSETLYRNSSFLQAFAGENKTIPAWIMRQAGRYLPEYQAIRAKHTLEEMFRNPEIASEVTCLPFKILDLDAAILFADILTLPSVTGFNITFEKKGGPFVNNPITNPGDVARIHEFDDIPYLRKEIALVLSRLDDRIPLIGFAGSPFTVLCYLVKGNSTSNINALLSFAYNHEKEYHAAMQKMTHNTIRYLALQQDAGIHVFQVFDTWAGHLRLKDYEKLVFPYIQEIFDSVKLPSIYYLKNCRHLLALMLKSHADFISVCDNVDIASEPLLNQHQVGIQGNFYNALLYADYPIIEEELKQLLSGVRRFKRYVFNLSHGIFPDIPVEKVKFVIDTVHQFPYR